MQRTHDTVVAGHVESPRTAIELPLAEVKRLTGLDLPPAEITGILQKLGFSVEGFGPFYGVGVPSWRPDVTMKADLVEEVMRMAGVDRVPVEPLPRLASVSAKVLTTIQNRRRLVRRALAARGQRRVSRLLSVT